MTSLTDSLHRGTSLFYTILVVFDLEILCTIQRFLQCKKTMSWPKSDKYLIADIYFATADKHFILFWAQFFLSLQPQHYFTFIWYALVWVLLWGCYNWSWMYIFVPFNEVLRNISRIFTKLTIQNYQVTIQLRNIINIDITHILINHNNPQRQKVLNMRSTLDFGQQTWMHRIDKIIIIHTKMNKHGLEKFSDHISKWTSIPTLQICSF